jgi:uncharacterized ferredoxin-like protein
MSIVREQHIKNESVMRVAQQMLLAARTAPKGKGRDTLEMFIAGKESLETLSKQMADLGDKHQAAFFHRDAKNVLQAEAVLVIGTRIETLGLNEMCQLCGFENCVEKEQHPAIPCVFNTGDLNLAIGSAVALAADNRVDNRVMFTIGKAAVALDWFETDVKIAMGIPLSAQSKNPFFDR